MKACQSCKTSNPDNAHFCRHCGKRFNDWQESHKTSNADQRLISKLQKDLKDKSNLVSYLLREESRLKRNFWITIVAILVVLAVIVFYCYKLEQPSYAGKRYLSTVIGLQDYVLIDGDINEVNVSLNSLGSPVRYSVQTNIDSVLVYGKPDWLTVAYNDSLGEMYVSASPNYLDTRIGHFTFGLNADTISVNVTQSAKSTQRLFVNGKTNVSSIISHLGETHSYAITSDDGKCVVKTKPDWCSIQRNSDGILSISFRRNPENLRRTGEISLSSGEYNATISVSQKAGERLNPITGAIKSISIEDNVYEGSILGMRIHASFSTHNMMNFEGEIAAYFYDSNGNRLKDSNGSYSTSDGQVAVSKRFVPSYENSVFDDFTIFIPYDEFNLPRGEYHLKMYCILWDLSKTAQKLDESEFYNFQYRR